MKTILTILSIVLISTAWTQELPRQSAKATVEQRVGLTDISINYSRPNVNGRVIFGDLVPYNEVWRLGANQPTQIVLSHPIEINNQKLDSGTYAIFAIPMKNQWKVVFNTDYEQWGTNSYDEKKNVLEYTTAVNTNEQTESFTISFESVTVSSAIIAFEWDQIKVSVPFTTETSKAVVAGIDAAVAKGEDLAKVYSRAADYFMDSGDKETASEYLAKSLKIERNYSNVFLEAQMMKDEDLKGAIKLAEEAATLADEAEKENWSNYIRRNADEWAKED